VPTSFQEDAHAGLHSSNFDVAANIESGDARAGLDDDAKRDIMRIMKRKNISFDQARLLHIQNKLRQNGIAPDGRPLDPKFVS